MDPVAQELHHLAHEVCALHRQLRADADERRDAREDQKILDGLLARSARIAKRLERLNAKT